MPGYGRGLSQSLVLVLVGALLVAALLTGFGWWRLAGFVGTAKWRDLHVLWLPVLILVLPLLGGVRPMPTNELLTLVVGYAATAFFEEALYRGVVLGLLRPRGIWSAVIISSVLFGLVHLSNIALRGNPGLIALQALGAAQVALVWPRSACGRARSGLALAYMRSTTCSFSSVGCRCRWSALSTRSSCSCTPSTCCGPVS